jgi:branched-chain amino acid transport system substrate-binding protein
MMRLGSFVALAIAFGCGGSSVERPASGVAASGGSGVVVAVAAPMSGELSGFGEALVAGVRLAAEEFRFRVVVFDTRSDVSSAPELVEFVRREEAAVVIGEVSSMVTAELLRATAEMGIPFVVPVATRADLTSIGDHAVRVCVTDDGFGRAMARHARERLGLVHVAIARDAGSEYSELVADAFAAEFASLGGLVVSDVSYSQGQRGFAEVLERIRGSSAEAIFVPGHWSDVTSLAVEARGMGIAMPFLGSDGWDSPELLTRHEAARALEGSFFATHWMLDADWPAARRFGERWRAAGEPEPASVAALGYDAVALVRQAAERVERGDAPSLGDALAGGSLEEGVTGRVRIGSSDEAGSPLPLPLPRAAGGEGSLLRTVVIARVRDGAVEYADRVDPR